MPVYAYDNKIPSIHSSAWIHPNSEIIGDVFIGPKVYVGSGSNIVLY
jgi:phenylacetic acid degradation protein